MIKPKLANDASFAMASPGKDNTSSSGNESPTATGRYVYCILDGNAAGQLGNLGIEDQPVRTITDNDISAIVSDIPYRQMESNLQQVVAHQRVVEEARNFANATGRGVVLPVRFGVIINGDAGVRKLLQTSAPKYKEKMRQLYQKDEFGIKVILGKEDVTKFRKAVELDSKNIQKIKDEIAASSNSGRAHFLKLKLQDAIKTETLRRIEDISGVIHKELASVAQSTATLKSDASQVVLNVSYLVDRSNIANFEQKVAELTQRFSGNGLTIHKSGPWAPYSFC